MMPLSELRVFAISRHGDQQYGDQPYVAHLDDVLAVVRRHGLGGAYERAAYGHDLLDDTPTTLLEVAEHFGPEEADLVFAVSGPGVNRAARRAETIRRLTAYPAGINLKAADRISNLGAALRSDNQRLIKMYLDEEAAFALLFSYAKRSLLQELEGLYDEAQHRLAKP